MAYMASLFRSWLFTKHDEYREINQRMGKGRRHEKMKRLLPKEIMSLENDCDCSHEKQTNRAAKIYTSTGI